MKGSYKTNILKKSGRYFLTAFFFVSFHLHAQEIDAVGFLKECGVDGSVTLYDYNNKRWMFSNEEDAKVQTMPASTFKIINSLVALETKAVKDENTVLKWDSVDRGNANWNADTDLKNAFKNSTLWFYQQIARKVGVKKYQKFLDKANFGNKKIGEKVDMFWIDGSLVISPIEQINFLVNLYEEKLPFSKKNMKTVKSIMVYESVDQYTLYAKTGWGFENGNDIGWWVGYLKTKENVYFFVTRLVMSSSVKNDDFGPCRKSITYEVFKKLGLIY